MMLKFTVYSPTLIYKKYKVGMQKLRHKTVVNTSLLFQKFQGLAGVDFGSVKFGALSSSVFLLYCFNCAQTPRKAVHLIVQGVQIKKRQIYWETN